METCLGLCMELICMELLCGTLVWNSCMEYLYGTMYEFFG